MDNDNFAEKVNDVARITTVTLSGSIAGQEKQNRWDWDAMVYL